MKPVPPQRRPGRERRSPDQCAQTKLKCDLDEPCETCHSQRITCTYVRLLDLSHQSEGEIAPTTDSGSEESLELPMGPCTDANAHSDLPADGIDPSLLQQLDTDGFADFLITWTPGELALWQDLFISTE